MTAEHQRAYVARQIAKDPEAWAEKQAAYARRRYLRHPDAKARLREKHPDEFAARARAARSAWAQRNPEKVRAHNKVKRELRAGRLMRPDRCAECQKLCKPQASHHDYSKKLEIEWLCQPCHRRKDRRYGRGGDSTDVNREAAA